MLAAELGHEVIHLNQPVYKIEHDASKGYVAAYTPHGHFTAKAVIVAMPPHLTGRIAYEPQMPPMRDQLTQRAPMGNIIKVFAIYKEPWWRKEGLSGLAAGDVPAIEFVADSTNPRPG
jgi:monoamine oxidase